MPSLLANFFGVLVASFIAITCASNVLVIAPATLFIRPFSIRLYRALARYVMDQWYRACLFFVESVNSKTKLFISGDELPQAENAVLISNHRNHLDWMYAWSLAHRKGRLPDFRAFIKASARFVPFFSWGWRIAGYCFLRRSWELDKNRIERYVQSVIQNQTECYLMLYPEGTRMTPKKLAQSQEFAKSRNLPVFKHVLTPRTKGFVSLFKMIRDYADAVYDITVYYTPPENATSTSCLWRMMTGTLNVDGVHMHVRRFASKDLPKTEEELDAWCRERWVEKEELLSIASRLGRFPENGEVVPPEGTPVPTPKNVKPVNANDPRLLVGFLLNSGLLATVFYLLATSPLFRQYAAVSAVGATLFTIFDSPEW